MNRSTENFLSALSRFQEALEWEEGPATRDSAILRFELCYETAWKAAQTFVRQEGLAVNGPRQSFAGGFRLGWFSDEKVWDDMIRARNNAVHTYNEDFAREMYRQLPVFCRAFEELRDRLKHE